MSVAIILPARKDRGVFTAFREKFDTKYHRSESVGVWAYFSQALELFTGGKGVSVQAPPRWAFWSALYSDLFPGHEATSNASEANFEQLPSTTRR